MLRVSVRTIWLQSIVCLGVIIGVLAGDVAVAHARVVSNHKRAVLRELHRAEAAYAKQVDTISGELFRVVQPVQDALDHLDTSRPQYIDAARDAVVNTQTSKAVTKLGARVAALRPTRTLTTQQTALNTAIKHMAKNLANLEKAKSSKDASDMLDEPYTTTSFSLSQDEDDWSTAVTRIDTVTHRAVAATPRASGEPRSKTPLPASKASWIFGADHVCAASSHAMYVLKDPGSGASLETLAKWEDRYAAIVSNVNTGLRKLGLPAKDRHYLQATIYRDLHANDTLATSARTSARAFRGRSLDLFNQALAQAHVASKGMSSLSHDMKAYGAEYCGWFFDPHAKPSSTKGGGGGTVSA